MNGYVNYAHRDVICSAEESFQPSLSSTPSRAQYNIVVHICVEQVVIPHDPTSIG